MCAGLVKSEEAILFMIPYPQTIGYAIKKLIVIFKQSALRAGFSADQIYFSYSESDSSLAHKNITECDFNDDDELSHLIQFIKKNAITRVVVFDLNYPSKIMNSLKLSGVSKVIAYWGAAISSEFTGVKLWLKKIEWYVRRSKPDVFIFESEAMRRAATNGRGVPEGRTVIVPLGVDVDLFYPSTDKIYIHDMFEIPITRRVVFYSGHMEQRKGVHIIIEAAIELVDRRHFESIHFVICGNMPGEELSFLNMLNEKKALEYVSFGGYRDDIPELMRCSDLGVIASVGWDSFTMSSVEMMASGLPLIVSDLQGLAETVDENVNGLKFPPGDVQGLSNCIARLLDDSALMLRFSEESRKRVEQNFTQTLQEKKIARVLLQS